MKERTLFEFNCSKRKSRVLIDLSIQFLLAMLFLFIGISTKIYWLIIIASGGIVIILYSLSIIKAKNFYCGKIMLVIEGAGDFEYKNLISIKKKQLNFILQFNWSVKLNEYDRSKAWASYLITFKRNNELSTSLVLVDPKRQNDFMGFIQHAKRQNNNIEIVL